MSVLPGMDPEAERSARTSLMLQGLADPRRLAILRHLLVSGSQYVVELTRAGLGASATVSAALADLTGRGLVECIPHGPYRLYAVRSGVRLPARDASEWGGLRCGTIDVWFPLAIQSDASARLPRPRRSKPRTTKGTDHAA